MQGYSCNYRNGFDTQGLWVEVEVEKELGFENKRAIENYGVERIKKFSGIITEQSKRQVKWEPEYIGKRMQDWLMNMGDWNI